MFDVPVYINVRDRVTPLRRLVRWLERAGHERIILLDNDSTYEPLIEYLKATPHDVICLGENLGSRALWRADLAPGGEYVYTDPDVLPIEECPMGIVDYLYHLLCLFPDYPKASLGLYLDDVPDIPSRKLEEELVCEGRRIADGVYSSLADTTFGLYRAGVRRHEYTSLRTTAPYQCRHTSWYHLDDPDEEERYYLDHAIKGRDGSSWALAWT